MKWEHLFSKKRLGREDRPYSSLSRTEFQRDIDRIVFSSPFRRLQNKTQVVPLPDSDHVRNRLTHSIETASVGRSIGTLAGEALTGKYPDIFNALEVHDTDLGALVSAACLAHDLGNPPFGHSGEDAISAYFQNGPGYDMIRECTPEQKYDLQHFEGNASGFRLLTSTGEAQSDLKGGLGLTYTTLAAFSKYPKQSLPELKKDKKASSKKYGFFQTEKEVFAKVADELNLRSKKGPYCWNRHPLAFLVEAADDICYHIIDFEDGFNLDIIAFETIEKLYIEILGSNWQKFEGRYKKIYDEGSCVRYLRSLAINRLIQESAKVFIDNEKEILNGTFDKPILSQLPMISTLKEIIDISINKCYRHRNVLEIEAAGFEVMSGLLDAFVPSIINGNSLKNDKIIQLYPQQYLSKKGKAFEDPYLNMINAVMFISSMTDNYALKLFKKIKGISLYQ